MTTTRQPPDLSRLLSLRGTIRERAEDMEHHRQRFQQLEARKHAGGTMTKAVSAWQLFQTPPDLAARLLELLGDMRGRSVLEPSAGLGRLALPLINQGVDVVAVDASPQCCEHLRSAGVPDVRQADFLTLEPSSLGLFDGVAMNPPFHMRADIKHILHARKFLFHGGRLAALCLDTPQRETALRHLCSTWEKIPAGAFQAEGTRVPTVLMIIDN